MDVKRTLAREVAKYQEVGLTTYLSQRFLLLCRILKDFASDFIVGRALNRDSFRCVFERYPDVAHVYKWQYLSRSFSKSDRLRSMVNHYRFIDKHFLPSFMASIMYGKILLWEKVKGDNRYSISLTHDEQYREGDLSLLY